MEKVCFGDGSFGVNKKVKGLNKRKQGVEKKKRLHQKENGRSSPRKWRWQGRNCVRKIIKQMRRK